MPMLRMLLPLLFAVAASSLRAAPPSAEIVTVPLPTRAFSVYRGDVRHLPHRPSHQPAHAWNEFEDPKQRKADSEAAPGAPNVVLAPMPAPVLSFDGLSFADSVTGGRAGAGFPPDVNGDVGPNHYIQAVNDAFAIYDKSGTLLAAFTENALWSAANSGTPCDMSNQGDPIAIHDALSDRWILSNFAFSNSLAPPFYQCLAVSRSSDPVGGGWYLYAIRIDTGAPGAPPEATVGDYPKFGLWNDCLYLGANGFDTNTGNYVGVIFASFSRADLYSGSPVVGASIGMISDRTDPYTMLPAHLMGTPPPAGTPAYFVSESRLVNAFEVRKFTAGANCGAGGVLAASSDISQLAYTVPGTNIVPQPGTGTKLDSLNDRLMQRVQYRYLNGAESLWVVHSVRVSNKSTVRPHWAELNVSGGVIHATPRQQQIFAPDTTLHRWMPSLAVDGEGGMALGYSTANGNAPNYPSIVYAGRLAGDALNQLPRSETTLIAGAAAQTNSCGGGPCHRWGDYSAMSVDPSDDCTFWYTNQYYDSAANGDGGNWHTRIGAFRFPTCLLTGKPTQLAFTLQPPALTQAGAVFSVKVRVENAAGNPITASAAPITLALSGGSAGATLTGTLTVNAVNGVAVFNDLAVDKAGTGYALTAASPTLRNGTSSSFAVIAGAPAQLVFTTQPAAVAQGGMLAAIAVSLEDAYGNVVADNSGSVDYAVPACGGSVVLGSVALINGVATLNSPQRFYTLAANPPGLQVAATAPSLGMTAQSQAFGVTPSAQFLFGDGFDACRL